MLGVVALPGVLRSVVFRPLRNPSRDQRYFCRGQRFVLLRHLGLAFRIRRYFFDEIRNIRFSGNNDIFRLSAREKLIESGHHVVPFGFGRLVAAMALRLKEGEDVFVIRNRGAALALGGCGANRREHGDDKKCR